jgi:tetratricopeptide (TPR) repeat protein
MQAADGDDLVKLAHALARLERLDEALFWVGETLKADDASAGIWRFRASLLERLGRFEEALDSAQGAQARGLPGDVAAEDIARIRRRMMDELQREADGPDPRKAVAALLKLSGLPEAERSGSAAVRDLSLLAAVGQADRDVLVQLAHACADADQLDDGLHWLRKAGELEQPDGEFLRFKASLLERSGRIDEALRTALEARQAGADLVAISCDIERLQGPRNTNIVQAEPWRARLTLRRREASASAA